MNNVILVAIVF